MRSVKTKRKRIIRISKNNFLKVYLKVIIDLIHIESLGFIKTKILPFAIVALFGIAFLAVSARIWLPGDMMSPAPMN